MRKYFLILIPLLILFTLFVEIFIYNFKNLVDNVIDIVMKLV